MPPITTQPTTPTFSSMASPGATQGSEPVCPGCGLSVESDNGGIVVAFGQSLWHVDCFKCAKCGNRVTADTNLLLLSDGSPVCGECSYNCSVCKLPILDEAIMTGDESYHAACFTCRTCSRRIDELVFAKTSQGIYCMSCHNERVARSRRHAENKKKKQAALNKRRDDDVRTKEKVTETVNTPTRLPNEAQTSPPLSATSPAFDTPIGTPRITNANPAQHQSAKRISTQSLGQSSFNGSVHSQSNGIGANQGVEVMPYILEPEAEHIGSSVPTTQQSEGRGRTTTLPLPTSSTATKDRRRSSYGPVSSTPSSDSASNGLGVPTSKADRRKSLNHSMNADNQLDDLRTTLSVYEPLTADPTNELQPASTLRSLSPSPAPSLLTQSDLPETSTEAPSASPLLNGRQRVNSQNSTIAIVNSKNGTPSSERATPALSSSQNAPAPPPKPVATPSSNVIDINKTTTPAIPPMSFTNRNSILGDFLSGVGDTQKFKLDPQIKLPGFTSESVPSINGKTTSASQPSSLISPTSSSITDGRSSLESQRKPASSVPELTITSTRGRNDSNASISSAFSRADNIDLVTQRVSQALKDARERSATVVKFDRDFVEAIFTALQHSQIRYVDLKASLDSMKRTSQRAQDGLSVVHTEYNHEVARLRSQISAQSAQLTALTAEERKRDTLLQMSKQLSEDVHGLEKDISKLRAERDMTIAEMEELSATKETGASAEPTQLSRSLTNRLDSLKGQYRRDLEPLIEEKERLQREIDQLAEMRSITLGETAVLSARNDELLDLNLNLAKEMESLLAAKMRVPEKKSKQALPTPPLPMNGPNHSGSLSAVTTSGTSSTLLEDREENRPRAVKSDSETNAFKKWFKGGKDTAGRDLPPVPRLPQNSSSLSLDKPRPSINPHMFQQQNTLFPVRCDHCGDKMWGQFLRCSGCSITVHIRCAASLAHGCSGEAGRSDSSVIEIQNLPPSMFGRDLVEQVRADSQLSGRLLPIIMEKCVQAVEVRAMDYEGIYRKSGGHGQIRMITQLFERGNYDAFDFMDDETFNDIAAITSVLKNFLRDLPNPLLTYELHDAFVEAAGIKDPTAKGECLHTLVNELPDEHREALGYLMVHLHRVAQNAEVNLMSSRNLGTVFGPTLMRSTQPGSELTDMAGRAWTMEWLIENAPQVFSQYA